MNVSQNGMTGSDSRSWVMLRIGRQAVQSHKRMEPVDEKLKVYRFACRLVKKLKWIEMAQLAVSSIFFKLLSHAFQAAKWNTNLYPANVEFTYNDQA